MKKAAALPILVAVMLLCVALIAEAQEPKRIPRIGFLTGGSLSVFPGRIEAFRQGLRELGYVERKNIVIEWRYSEGKLDRLPALAAELVRLKVDIIVSGGPTPTGFLKEATTTIPIVMGFHTDPVGTGLAASLARPCENITGLSVLSPELGGKRLELLKEIVPKLSRVAVLGSSTLPGNAQTLRETELAAGALGVKLQYFDVLSPKDMEAAFRRAVTGRADAVLALGNPVLNAHRSPNTSCRSRGKEPAPGDVLRGRICGSRGAYVLWRGLFRFVQARRYLCGQDPQRR
ncbi:MAG TPA: ABC transporter substrate-binding protein [Candidatus Binatia bacterium]